MSIFKLIVGFVFILSIVGNMYSQEISTNKVDPKNAFYINLSGVAINVYSVGYERALGKLVSLGVGVYYSPNYFWFSNEEVWYANVQVKMYLGKILQPVLHSISKRFLGDAVNGPYVSLGGSYGKQVVSLRYQFSSVNGVSSYYKSITSGVVTSVALKIGDKLIFGEKPGFFLDAAIGVNYSVGSTDIYIDNNGSVSTGFSISPLISLVSSVRMGITF